MNTFWRHGYDATSLDELSAATGLNWPSLYAGFGDKRDLFLETLRRYREESRAASRTLLAEALPLREFLRRFYAIALDFYFDGEGKGRGCYSVLAAATQALVDEDVRHAAADSIRSTDDFLMSQIQRAQVAGEIATSADPETLARLATATLHTLAVRSRAGASRKHLMAIAEGAIAILCGAGEAAPPSPRQGRPRRRDP